MVLHLLRQRCQVGTQLCYCCIHPLQFCLVKGGICLHIGLLYLMQRSFCLHRSATLLLVCLFAFGQELGLFLMIEVILVAVLAMLLDGILIGNISIKRIVVCELLT